MVVAKLVRLAQGLFRRTRKGPSHGLHSPEQTRTVLARERARADRAHEPVSVVTFVPREQAVSQATWERLVPVLKGRLRSTDEAGWLDGSEGPQVCVILPGTDGPSAGKVVEDVLRRFAGPAPLPIILIYSYPSTARPERLSETRAEDDHAPSDAVASLEALFLQAMPPWKRALDVASTLVGLIVLSPLFLVIAMAVKLSSPGPVFFRQLRSGRGGRPFWMWKFRSMVPDAEDRKKGLLALNEQDGPAFKIKRDPRVTAVGRFLRATSLDELPQLWNVLKGEMSLVGPRPLPCSETEGCVGWQRRRLDVVPGLTCIWQVRGRSNVSFADWMRMDVQYVRSYTLGHDLKLLFLTVPALVLRKGAH